MVEKHHPDLYSALRDIQKEQADSEIMLAELSLGKSVKSVPKNKRGELQNRIKSITESYDEYKTDQRKLQFLRLIAHFPFTLLNIDFVT